MSIFDFHLSRPAEPYQWFEIAGEAQSWKRAGGRGSRKFNKSKGAQTRIKEQTIAALGSIELDGLSKFGLRLCFFHAEAVATRRDLDNQLKNIMDALQGIAWKNDCQIREVYAVAVPHERARTEVLIYKVSEDYLAKRSERG